MGFLWYRSIGVAEGLSQGWVPAMAQDRGFETGQTLPDISLIDLKGREVRFSDFLGKQYVLYGWSSW